jgi:hypothetical protein
MFDDRLAFRLLWLAGYARLRITAERRSFELPALRLYLRTQRFATYGRGFQHWLLDRRAYGSWILSFATWHL